MVLISSAVRFEEVKKWLDAGGNDVIVKPISTEVLKAQIASLTLNPKLFVTTRTFTARIVGTPPTTAAWTATAI